MIGPEGRAPYDRTILSKAALAGEKAVNDLTTTSTDALADRGIVPVPGEVAAVESGQVMLSDGGRHAFDALLLAPGGAADVPDLPDIDPFNVHTLRSAKDADELPEAAGASRRAVLVGGGFIGMEGALSLAKRGLAVTVGLREEVPLARSSASASATRSGRSMRRPA